MKKKMKNISKRLIAIALALVTMISIVGVAVPVEAEAATYDSYYFPKYTGKSSSLVDALKAIGVDSSFSFRSKIAAANGISGYRGSAAHNRHMHQLVKKGQLVNPSAKIPSGDAEASYYFPRYTGKSSSLVDALKAIGVDSSFSFRSKIAAANNISRYRGYASQNATMLNLLKKGQLRRTEAQISSGAGDSSITYYETTVKTTLRADAYEASAAIVSVPKNATVMVLQQVTNKYGNLWYKARVYTSDGIKEGYLYSGKLKSHVHSYKSFDMNEITYRVCHCGDVQVNASSSAKIAEGQNAVSYAISAVPLALGAADGPFPVGDLIGVGIMIVVVCLTHDILLPTKAELAEMVTKADFEEYLKKREDACDSNSFRKVAIVGDKLQYIDKHCLDIFEAYVYCYYLNGNVYTYDENNALSLAAMYAMQGKVMHMQRDKNKETYYFHYHFCKTSDPTLEWLPHVGGHVFFGENDLGQTPT